MIRYELEEIEAAPDTKGRFARREAQWSPMTYRYRMLSAMVLIVFAMFATIPGRGLRNYAARVRFLASCSRELKTIGDFSVVSSSQNLIRTLQERPHVIGIATWPYINGLWTTAQRFAALQAHYAEIESFYVLQIGTRDRVVVSDLGSVVPGLTIAIDRPNWFMREGELTVNLFNEEFRAYSLAFTFARVAGQRVMYVGCIQGRQAEGVEQMYRDLTKTLHGWRPRDVMVALAQMIGSAAEVSKIYLVSDAARVHRHKYFGDQHEALMSANYDEIWSEHGAVVGEGGFFELGTDIRRREHHQMSSNKRAMYRRRYELMDSLARDVNGVFASGGPDSGLRRVTEQFT